MQSKLNWLHVDVVCWLGVAIWMTVFLRLFASLSRSEKIFHDQASSSETVPCIFDCMKNADIRKMWDNTVQQGLSAHSRNKSKSPLYTLADMLQTKTKNFSSNAFFRS